MGPDRRNQRPAPERIYEMAQRVTAAQPALPDGSAQEYHDSLISITTQLSRRPNIVVEIRRGDERQLVFAAQRNEPGYPLRYNPGRWITHLEELAEQADADDERFMKIDDSDVFPD